MTENVNTIGLIADKPNLWRVACELAKFDDPYKAADMLLAVVLGGKEVDAA